jgi:diguanylate cyclase (GGDEF)-like protein
VKKKQTTLKKELFLKVALFSALILAVFGSLFAYLLYSSEVERVNTLLEERNVALKNFIEARFLKLRNLVEFLSEVDEIRNAPNATPKEREKALALYRRFQEIDPDINYIYSGYADGTLLINNYIPPEGYDPRIRPWYLAALESHPETSGGIPYTEIKTGEWLVSISKTLLNDRGEINGVVSAETSMESISKVLQQAAGNYRSFYSYVIRSDGKVLIHHREAFRGRLFQEVTGSPFSFDSVSGHFTYQLNGALKLAYYSKIEPLDWIVVTAVEKREIVIFILKQILKVVAIVAVLSLLLGWILSGILSDNVISPVIKLKQHVEQVANGNWQEKFRFEYPNNEIGSILKSIEQLTQSELYKKNLQLQAANRKLEELSITDQLTGLYNRRKLYAELERECERMKRYNRAFSVIMLDLDNFKDVNDAFGHQRGDKTLIEIANLIKGVVRSVDIVSRWGGDEFLILCPETELSEARELADRLRRKIAEHSFPGGIQVTASMGVCEISPEDNIEQFLSKVDEMLYRAKNSGKNTVMT